MCGLFGIISLNDKHELSDAALDAVARLAVMNRFRGQDSIGFISHRFGSDSYQTKKSVSDPFDYIAEEWPRQVNSYKQKRPMLVMGHTRWATRGDLTLACAHPFRHGNVIGMHNGTIGDKDKPEFTNHEKFKTDSEALIHNLDALGPKKALLDVAKVNNCAYALTWVNVKTHIFSMIRNYQRPLHMAKVNDVLMYSSDDDAMTYGLYGTEYQIKRADIVAVSKYHYLDLRDPGDLFLFEDWYEDITPYVYNRRNSVSNYGFGEGRDGKAQTETTNRGHNGGTGWNRRDTQHFAFDLRIQTEDYLRQKEEYLLDTGVLYKSALQITWDPETEWYFQFSDLADLNQIRHELKRRQQSFKHGTDIIDLKQVGNRYVSEKLYDGLLSRGCCLCSKPSHIDDDVLWVRERNDPKPEADAYICESCQADIGEDDKHWVYEYAGYWLTKDSIEKLRDRVESNKALPGGNEDVILAALKTAQDTARMLH